MDILLVPEYFNINANHPSLKWDVNNINLFKNWNNLDFLKVINWQYDSNKCAGDINLHTSQCIYDLLYNS